MGARIQWRRRVTSGNIKDPEFRQERLNDIQMKRQAFWTVILIVVGSVVFIAASVAIQISG